MTTDAKIGLLLALVFIVAITFVINGLPDFLSNKDKTDVTSSYISHYNRPDEPGIVDKSSRDAAAALNKKVISVPTPSAPEVNTTQNTSYQAILPAASEVVKSTSTDTAPQHTAVIDIPAASPALATERSSVAKANETTYEVSDGDSLSSIAQQFYGQQAGNKFANIRKIYEANKNILKSMNDLQVGQKLAIPSLNEKEQTLVNTGMFEKVNKETKTVSVPKEVKSAPAPKQSKSSQEYVVKENDTLWKIAAKYLGDGNKYNEIAELNKSIDPDNLVVGTKIKLPAK